MASRAIGCPRAVATEALEVRYGTGLRLVVASTASATSSVPASTSSRLLAYATGTTAVGTDGSRPMGRRLAANAASGLGRAVKASTDVGPRRRVVAVANA